ncbi:MAG: SprB repeat-containing protein, partial [Flavobacteriales bacterium]|nr:SprB repeat-containing protein [Flavobacteriales bacterium]
ITNITAPGGEEMYLQATLDNLNHPCNSSPIFTSDPVPYVCVGQTFCFNHGAIDAEGDSMSFSLIEPYDQGITDPINYLPGFSAGQPISSSPLITFDPITGDICMTPSALEVSVTAVVIEHWSNGLLVGTTMRDIQIHTVVCTNILPTVDGIDATNSFTTNACAGTPITFVTNGTDTNVTNLLTMSWNAGIPGATFNISGNGTTTPIGTFSWTPTTAQVSNTPYCFTVTIQDDQCPLNGFQIYSFCITVGAGTVTANAVTTDANCAGACNGQAVVTGGGGTLPYTYSSDGISYVGSNLFTGLCAGPYNFYVMDSNGCANNDSVNLIDPPPLLVTTSSTNVSCNGGNDGITGITVSGGTPPYNYVWSNGPTTAFNTGLTSGTYSVIITDANGCIDNQSIIITDPIIVTATSTSVNPTCLGNDGQITITPAGGAPGYSYSWSHDPSLNLPIASSLLPGNYTVVVSDVNGCSFTVSQTLIIFGFADANFTYNGNQCFTGNNFVFTNLGSTGAGIVHGWDFGVGLGTSALENPSYAYSGPGTYNVQHFVSDGACFDTIIVAIQVYDEPTSTVSSTPALCNGAADGTINLTIVGGTPNYGYFWNNGEITQDLTGLTAGIYTVIVADNNGCLTYDTIAVAEPIALSASNSANPATCDGICSGNSTVTVGGGTLPYAYIWNDPTNQTAPTAIGLCEGLFIATITDANGCIVQDTSSILNTDTVTILSSILPSTCGQPDGELTANPSGGTGPYSYLWNPTAQNTQTAIGLPAGTYVVSVMDFNGCMGYDTLVISDIPAPTAAISSFVDVACNGDATGEATVLASGGTGVYTYNWSPSGGSNTLATGLVTGFYTATVTDNAGCITAVSVFINEPTALTILVGPINANCGLADGSASVIVSGGTVGTGYQYSWSNSLGFVIGTTPSINISAGTYYVNVTDDNFCTISDSIVVNENPPGVVTTAAVAMTCFASCNGSGIAAISGGTPPFQFQWDDPALTNGQNVTGLCNGVFIVTVTDGIGCIVIDSITVFEPLKLNVGLLSIVNVTCFGFSDGAAEVDASGGTPPYQYQWDANAGNQTTSLATTLGPGTYAVVVTDVQGCTASMVVLVGEPAEVILSESVTDAHCSSPDGVITVNIISGGIAPFNYSWTGSGSTTNVASGLIPGSYTVTVTDNDGCIQNMTATVGNVPAGIATITNAINPSCFLSCNGLASVSMSGTGVAPFSYSWDDPSAQTTITATGLCAGILYTVTVTDA